MMSLPRQDDELRIRDLAGEMVGGVPMGSVGCAMMFVIADEDESRNTDLFQTIGVIVFLASEHEVKIVLQWGDPGYPNLKERFDQVRMRGDEFFGPPGFCRVLANVAFEAFPNHVAAHGKRNAVGPWMRRTAGGKDEFLDFLWMVQSQELAHDPAHGVTANDRLFHP